MEKVLQELFWGHFFGVHILFKLYQNTFGGGTENSKISILKKRNKKKKNVNTYLDVSMFLPLLLDILIFRN